MKFTAGTLIRTTVAGYPPRGILVALDMDGEDALVAMDSTGRSFDGIGVFRDVKLYTIPLCDMEEV